MNVSGIIQIPHNKFREEKHQLNYSDKSYSSEPN